LTKSLLLAKCPSAGYAHEEETSQRPDQALLPANCYQLFLDVAGLNPSALMSWGNADVLQTLSLLAALFLRLARFGVLERPR
jgi:hypothetical protein